MMRRFINNKNGAVTVFVTLLLIPAVLISGTAVDLARIHTARSIIQDANQLAANSVLTQYNALLQNLYGLYGVSETDPILAGLLDEYIKVSVFGEKSQDKGVGTFQLFYGSDITTSGPEFAEGMNLGSDEVLRRQIEEYMKFRGPVIIVKEIIEAIGSNKIKEDAELLESKIEIDETIADIYEKYTELYEAIVAADLCISPIYGISGGYFAQIGKRTRSIYDKFVSLLNCYEAWTSAKSKAGELKNEKEAMEENDEEDDKDYKKKAEKLDKEIEKAEAMIIECEVRYESILVSLSASADMDYYIAEAKKSAEEFKTKFDKVVQIAREIDSMNAELKKRLEEFERKLEEKECSDEIYEALTEPFGKPPKSVLERYRDILKWDHIEGMAVPYRDEGYNYIDNIHKPMLDTVRFRSISRPDSEGMSRPELAAIRSNPEFELSDSISSSSHRIAVFAAYNRDDTSYNMLPGFKKFADISNDNRAFYNELKDMMTKGNVPPVKLYDEQSESGSGSSEKRQRGMINQLLDLVEELYTGLINEPMGAMYIKDSETPAREKMGVNQITNIITEALDMPVIRIFSNPLEELGKAGDYILLLTYSTSMFSNYTTARPESIGVTRDNMHKVDFPKSMSGTRLSPEVNYFFQSEWEYMYSGHASAAKNLNAVTRLIFMVRMLCNYITVFNVPEINTIVRSIYMAFSWSYPLAVILAELARAAFVAAESLVDVSVLRSGDKVPLLKKSRDWVCSPGGLIKALEEIKSATTENKPGQAKKQGLTYSNYIMFFFLTKAFPPYIGAYKDAATELAVRTGELIEWNIINYERAIYSDEAKMLEAIENESRFKLSGMKTDFSITTTADFRMLFLSMIFAQKFSDSRGIGMPKTMQIIVTDHRGY